MNSAASAASLFTAVKVRIGRGERKKARQPLMNDQK
jgi:hypothetical protein